MAKTTRKNARRKPDAAVKKRTVKRSGRKTTAADLKRIRFAHEVWTNGNQAEAYRKIWPSSLKWDAASVAKEAWKTRQHPVVAAELEVLRSAQASSSVVSREEVMMMLSGVVRGETLQVIEVVLDQEGKKCGERVRPPTINERMRAGREVMSRLPSVDEGAGDGAAAPGAAPEVCSTLDERLAALRKKRG